ncbi:hypothetical protein ES705_50375 [subsurface metagenome]
MEKRPANPGKVGIGKVVITGPESTGKTTLAQQLAHHKQELEAYGFSYRIITGKNTNRLQNAIKIMDVFFSR